MSRFRSALIVGLGIAALAIPAGAVAAHGESHGKAKGHERNGAPEGNAGNGAANGNAGNGKTKGHARAQTVGYLFKGFYAGDGMVEVKRGNSHVRRGGFLGETVEFELAEARIVARDADGDGERTAADLEEGDWVLVKARLPRREPGSQPFDARWLIDKTSLKNGDDVEEGDDVDES